jgi:hypothetical protein
LQPIKQGLFLIGRPRLQSIGVRGVASWRSLAIFEHGQSLEFDTICIRIFKVFKIDDLQIWESLPWIRFATHACDVQLLPASPSVPLGCSRALQSLYLFVLLCDLAFEICKIVSSTLPTLKLTQPFTQDVVSFSQWRYQM